MKYYIKDWDETIDDAAEFNHTAPGHDSITASLAAEHAYGNRDGWESIWPLTIVLVSDDGKESYWVVEVEPAFYAHKPDGKGGVMELSTAGKDGIYYTELCDICNGSGITPHTGVVCWRCFGSGYMRVKSPKVEETITSGDTTGEKPYPVYCPHCGKEIDKGG